MNEVFWSWMETLPPTKIHEQHCLLISYPAAIARCKCSPRGRDQLIFAISVTNMLCCFLHIFTYHPSLSFVTLCFSIYKLRSVRCVLSTSAPSGTEGETVLASISIPNHMCCVCVCPYASFVQAFSLVALVSAFRLLLFYFLSAHTAQTQTYTHTQLHCRCKANWEFTACHVRERLALLSVLVACQLCFSAFSLCVHTSLTLNSYKGVCNHQWDERPKSIF